METMVILIMGVAGSGKTTIGSRLAVELGWEFIDADDFHSKQNIEKMASGIPLTETDRAPWLEELNTKLIADDLSDMNVVIACSALTQSFRNELLKDIKHICIVDLQGDYEFNRIKALQQSGSFFQREIARESI